jgi:alpha-galactosidase/6-phospho-beta-glucosidase family protein
MAVLQTITAQAPWYAKCIIPFLAALTSDHPYEFIVTWKHNGQVPTLPDITAESTVVVEGMQVRRASQAIGLPEFAAEWLRLVRASERLLIDAVRQQSYDLAVQSLVIHPNVASLDHAERLAERYFRDEK